MRAGRRGPRRGIILPAVLAALVALGLLSALALFDAVLDWRVAGSADDELVARAAMHEGLDALARPTDLALLCVSPSLAAQFSTGASAAGGRYRLTWSHLGDGLVRAEAEGRGRQGAVARATALLRPDSSERELGLVRCPQAARLVPAGAGWLTASPGG